MKACAALFLASVLAVSTLPAQMTDPNNRRGFEPGKLYAFGDLDSIATFNGNLNVRMPIGPVYTIRPGFSYRLILAYNSKVWEYDDSTGYRNAVPERDSNSGMGWTLGMGRFVKIPNSASPPDDARYWLYMSADGGRHEFSPALRPGFTTTTDVYYTTDGSYMRLTVTRHPVTGMIVGFALEMPDGLTHYFNDEGMLKEIRDRYGNWVRIRYELVSGNWLIRDGFGPPCPDPNTYPCETETVGRTHYVRFETDDVRYSSSTRNFQKRVKDVELAAFRDSATGHTSIYHFIYEHAVTATGSCGAIGDTNNAPPPTTNVPFLQTIELPDHSTFDMVYNKTEDDAPCASGTLQKMTVPTKATISWEHGSFALPREACIVDTSPRFGNGRGIWDDAYPGVLKRTLTDAAGTVLELTKYTPALAAMPNGTFRCEDEIHYTAALPPRFATTTITTLNGETTVNHFSAFHAEATEFANSEAYLKEYGLPFRRPMMSSGAFLSTETSSGGNVLRKTYLTYEGDEDGNTPLANVRVTSTRTEFLDDEGDPDYDGDNQDTLVRRCRNAQGQQNPCAITQQFSGFDGYGHLRTSVTTSNFPCGGPASNLPDCTQANRRTTVTSYNPGMDTSTSWPVSSPWILDTYSGRTVTEGDVSRATRVTFNDEGEIESSGTNSGRGDMLTATCRDARGFVTSERFLGGDSQAIPAQPCNPSYTRRPGEYVLNHTWSPATSDAAIPTTHTTKYEGTAFDLSTETIDPMSGLVSKSADPAGLETSYSYDKSFRLETVTPSALAPTSYIYATASVNGTTLTPAQVEVKTTSSDPARGAIDGIFQFDAAGRLWREKTLMPDGTWSVRETLYDHQGRKASVSEQVAETLALPWPRTTFANYDPFGRVGFIETADGKVTWLTYAGARKTTTTRTIADGSGERPVSTVERYDGQGRLGSVTENAGSSEAQTTFYDYGPGGELTSVTAGSQVRTFVYDGRGMLTAERHPELGVDGNGTTAYQLFDAKGQGSVRTTGTANGAFDVRLAYDAASRLTAVTGADGTKIKELVYDHTIVDGQPAECTRCKGKLVIAARYNAVPDLGTVGVSTVWSFDAVTGLPARLDRAISAPHHASPPTNRARPLTGR